MKHKRLTRTLLLASALCLTTISHGSSFNLAYAADEQQNNKKEEGFLDKIRSLRHSFSSDDTVSNYAPLAVDRQFPIFRPLADEGSGATVDDAIPPPLPAEPSSLTDLAPDIPLPKLYLKDLIVDSDKKDDDSSALRVRIPKRTSSSDKKNNTDTKKSSTKSSSGNNTDGKAEDESSDSSNRMIPKRRPVKNYNTQQLSDKIYKKAYNSQNKHLPKIYYVDEYKEILFDSAAKGNVDVLRTMIDYFDTTEIVDEQGNTPLLYATMAENRHSVLTLLHMGANPNAANYAGISPLYTAVFLDHADLTEALLQHRANPNVTNKVDKSLLILAMQHNDDKIARLLLDYGINPNLAMLNDETALHIAVKKGDASIVQSLLKHGAHVNAQTDKGHTPLMLAAYSGNAHIVDILIKAGAASAITNQNNVTAIDIAQARGFSSIAADIQHNAVETPQEQEVTLVGETNNNETDHADSNGTDENEDKDTSAKPSIQAATPTKQNNVTIPPLQTKEPLDNQTTRVHQAVLSHLSKPHQTISDTNTLPTTLSIAAPTPLNPVALPPLATEQKIPDLQETRNNLDKPVANLTPHDQNDDVSNQPNLPQLSNDDDNDSMLSELNSRDSAQEALTIPSQSSSSNNGDTQALLYKHLKKMIASAKQQNDSTIIPPLAPTNTLDILDTPTDTTTSNALPTEEQSAPEQPAETDTVDRTVNTDTLDSLPDLTDDGMPPAPADISNELMLKSPPLPDMDDLPPLPE